MATASSSDIRSARPGLGRRSSALSSHHALFGKANGVTVVWAGRFQWTAAGAGHPVLRLETRALWLWGER